MKTDIKNLFLLLLMMMLPAMGQAQFTYGTNNGTITITGYSGPGGDVTIPDTITGLPVTTIGNSAFRYNGGLTSVTIPGSVINIGDYAFDYCSGLVSITIPNSVTDIGSFAFFACFSLANITIPDKVTSIGAYEFSGCSSLTSVTIPNGVTNIGDYAFSFCSSLTKIMIPSSVTSIGTYEFYGCDNVTNTGLTGVFFRGDAPSVGPLAFDSYSKATVYYLPATTGWEPTFAGRPTALWVLPNPLILDNGPSFGVQANGFGFIISWATNISVVVEASTNLANSGWYPLQTNALIGGSFYFSDPQWTNHAARFYRIRSP